MALTWGVSRQDVGTHFSLEPASYDAPKHIFSLCLHLDL